MEKQKVLESIKKARESKKRNFSQTFDLIINLKDINLKVQENQIDLFVNMPHQMGRKLKYCLLIGGESKDNAVGVDAKVVSVDEFPKYQADKKLAKKLAEDYDIFIAQATIMPKIAQTFGKIFGPRNKMPNPKSGAICPPKPNFNAIIEKMNKTARITAKTALQLHAKVGSEKMSDEDVAENIIAIYNQVIHHIPGERNNIKEVLLKLTMGKTTSLEY